MAWAASLQRHLVRLPGRSPCNRSARFVAYDLWRLLMSNDDLWLMNIDDDLWWLMHPCLLTLSRLLSSYVILAVSSLKTNRSGVESSWILDGSGIQLDLQNRDEISPTKAKDTSWTTCYAPFSHFSPSKRSPPYPFKSWSSQSPRIHWSRPRDILWTPPLLQVHLFQDFEFRRCTAQETEIRSVSFTMCNQVPWGDLCSTTNEDGLK